MDSVQVNTSNLDIILTVTDSDGILDVSTATLIQYCIRKPDGSSNTVTVNVLTDGVDGQVTYTIPLIDLKGVWKIQVRVTNANGYYPSTMYSFYAKRNLACF